MLGAWGISPWGSNAAFSPPSTARWIWSSAGAASAAPARVYTAFNPPAGSLNGGASAVTARVTVVCDNDCWVEWNGALVLSVVGVSSWVGSTQYQATFVIAAGSTNTLSIIA
jgi:hypothetical protein